MLCEWLTEKSMDVHENGSPQAELAYDVANEAVNSVVAAEAAMSSGAGSSVDGAGGKKGGHKGMGSSSSKGVGHARRCMYEEFVKGKKGKEAYGEEGEEEPLQDEDLEVIPEGTDVGNGDGDGDADAPIRSLLYGRNRADDNGWNYNDRATRRHPLLNGFRKISTNRLWIPGWLSIL